MALKKTIAIAVISALALCRAAKAEVSFFSDNFNAYTASSPLPYGSGTTYLWSNASNTSPFQSLVEQDSGNLFQEGTSNNYLMMAVTGTSGSGYYVSTNLLSTTVPAGNLSFNFYQLSGTANQGSGYLLRIGNGTSGNSSTAFGVGFDNGALYLATGAGVNLSSTSLATYSLNQPNSLSAYFNNAASSPYLYTVGNVVYSLPAGLMDVWLNGARVGAGLGKAGGIGTGTNINQFNLTDKANFVGTTYVDDIVLKSIASGAPSAPAGLATTSSCGIMAVSWSPVTGATNYTIASGTVSGGPYTIAGTSGSAGFSFFPPAGNNYIIVAATNSTDTGAYSAEVSGSITLPSGVPGQITGVATVTGTLLGQDVVSWQPQNGSNYATSYTILRSLTSGGPFVTLASGITGTSFTDNSLLSGQTYYYEVEGINSLGSGLASTAVSGTAAGPQISGTQTSIFSENFNGYTAGSNLPTGGLWSSVTGTGGFQSLVTSDSNNIFAEGTANNYLAMGATVLNGSAGFFDVTKHFSSIYAGCLSFNFYQPMVSDPEGNGFFFRIGNNWGNAATAFALYLQNGALYQSDNTVVNPDYDPFVWYNLNQKHTLSAYFNNTGAGTNYQYVSNGQLYSVAPGSMDVWLDGTCVGQGFGKCGGLVTGTAVNEFDFSSKINFLGALSVDDIVVASSPSTALSPVSGLAMTITGTQVALNWTPVSGATGYTVARGTTSGGPYTILGLTGTTTYTDYIPSASEYYYILVATSGSQASAYSTEISTGPGQVTGLTAVSGSVPQEVLLTWQPQSGATSGYNVMRSIYVSGSYYTIAAGVTGTAYTDIGVPNGSAYYYEIAAVDSYGAGPASLPASATPNGAEVSVFTENFSSYTPGAALPTSGTGKWISASNTPPFQALVEQDTGNLFGGGTSANYLLLSSTALSASSCDASVNPLAGAMLSGSLAFNFYQPSGSGYTGNGFILRLGNGTNGDSSTAFALAIQNGGLYLATGSSVVVSSSSFATYSLNQLHTLAVYFNNNLATTYRYTVAGKNYFVGAGKMDVWLDGTSRAQGLVSGGALPTNTSINEFNFTSKANFIGTLYVSNFAEGELPILSPAVPSTPSVAVNGNQVSLSWSAVPEAISYAVLRSATSGGPYTAVNAWVTPNLAYTDTVPSPGTYYYVVAATNPSCTGSNSAEVSAAVSAPTAVPSVVTGGTTTALTGTAILNWQPATGANYATSYNVGRSTTSGGPYTIVSGTGTALTSYVDTGLTTGTTYYYVISGSNSVGTGANSVQISATPAAAPTDGTTSFVDNWQADPAKGGWGSAQIMSPGRLQRDVNTATWHGFSTARVEVRPQDNPINSTGERSEVLTMKTSGGQTIYETATSGTQYFAASFMFPTTWQNTVIENTGWSVVFQLHGPDTLGASPVFALSANSIYQFALNGGDLNGSSVGPYYATYNLSDGGSLNLGTWTDFVFEINFASTPTGSLTVWRRNQGQTAFTKVLDVQNIPTLQYSGTSGVGNHYWKHGLYRGSNFGTITNVFWTGPAARGASFKAVEWAAFGTATGQP